ncbi:MAG: PAS domain-containing protein [Rhodoplanes sp.]|uniref:PAS and helix-turn-helix domain-containing protein n=1 Tax=Rhodoplanes sp. TaxID=1968906 RepID=UPI001797555F|nr:PAS and helix-turn-helix domain-containing protein [Rhodoplanes sp.]NVO17437.1 PAS domain-containing protein [Rhodoplanes sp.]
MQIALARFETLRALAVNVTVLDPDGTIVETNATWRDPSPANGATLPDGGRGLNYLSLCPPERARQLEALIEGHCDLFTCVYACRSARDTRWMLLVAVPLDDTRPRGVTLLHVNLSGLLPFDIAREGLRALHAPEAVPAPTLDAIVHTIEDTIARSMGQGRSAAGPGAVAGPVAAAGAGTAADATAERCAEAGSEPVSIVDQFPKRQRQVFRLLGEGRSNGEIAAALGISANTAKLHVAAVLRRLGLDNRMQAVALAARVTGEPS